MEERQINFGSFIGEQLAAKLHILPLTLFMGDEKFSFGGIAGVATWPEFRRAGHINHLLKQSFVEMKERGYSLSMLHPFLIKFYRKFGYEVTNYTYRYDLTPNDIATYHSTGNCKRVTFEREKDTIKKLYEATASEYSLMMDRDDWWWRKRVISDKDTIILYYNEAGEALGYLIANINDSHLRVEEMVYQSTDACRALLQWVKNHDSMIDTITLIGQPNQSIAFYLDNPRIPLTKKAYFMTRIIDFAAFIKDYPYFTVEENVQIAFQVEDIHAPWNSGNWLVTIQENHCKHVEKVDHAIDGDITFAMDINGLTALLLGSESLENLHRFGVIQVEEKTVKWNDITAVNETHLLDYF